MRCCSVATSTNNNNKGNHPGPKCRSWYMIFLFFFLILSFPHPQQRRKILPILTFWSPATSCPRPSRWNWHSNGPSETLVWLVRTMYYVPHSTPHSFFFLVAHPTCYPSSHTDFHALDFCNTLFSPLPSSFGPQGNPTGPRLVKNWVSLKTTMLCGITIPKTTTVVAADSPPPLRTRGKRKRVKDSDGGSIYSYCETREKK
jgi:hypothetical protein